MVTNRLVKSLHLYLHEETQGNASQANRPSSLSQARLAYPQSTPAENDILFLRFLPGSADRSLMQLKTTKKVYKL